MMEFNLAKFKLLPAGRINRMKDKQNEGVYNGRKYS